MENECIICLDEIENSNKSYILFPIQNNICKCKFIIHYSCFEKCNFCCPICKKEIKNLNFENIIGDNKFEEVYLILTNNIKKEIVSLDSINIIDNENYTEIIDNINTNRNNVINESEITCKKIFVVSTLIVFIFLLFIILLILIIIK